MEEEKRKRGDEGERERERERWRMVEREGCGGWVEIERERGRERGWVEGRSARVLPGCHQAGWTSRGPHLSLLFYARAKRRAEGPSARPERLRRVSP